MILRAELDITEGRGPELVAELDALLDQHPFEERIWAQLMIALHRSGRQADALETYQRVRRLFLMELGAEPGEPLARLQAQLLAGEDPGPERAAGAPAPPASLAAPIGVPHPPGTLIGRAADMAGGDCAAR